MAMVWHDLLFAHWPVEADLLRPLIPSNLELDTFDGSAWVGVVPFRMSGIRHRFLPPLPGLSAFPEINVRTYVTENDKPGVWFFSLDAASQVAVWTARRTFHLPYYYASMSCRAAEGRIEYRSERRHRGAPSATFIGSYAPVGVPFLARPGAIDHWLTARYCLYSQDARQQTYRGDIDHAAWPLQRAELDLGECTMAGLLGSATLETDPILHFAKRLSVLAWALERT